MKPLSIYLLALSTATSGVIIVGSWCANLQDRQPSTSSHGVSRVLGQSELGSLLKTGPGLARSSSGIRGEASMVSAQGEASPNDPKTSDWPVGSLPTRNVENGVTLRRDEGFASRHNAGPQGSILVRGSVDARIQCLTEHCGDSQGVRSEREAGESLMLRPSSGLRYEVTAYSHGCTLPRSGRERPAQRGADGRWPIAELTVAADTSLHPFGTEVLIEGLGFRRVGDKGHAIKGRRLDLFLDSCDAARKFGRRWLSVTVVPAETTRWASR